jgi:hypothetical protein
MATLKPVPQKPKAPPIPEKRLRLIKDILKELFLMRLKRKGILPKKTLH